MQSKDCSKNLEASGLINSTCVVPQQNQSEIGQNDAPSNLSSSVSAINHGDNGMTPGNTPNNQINNSSIPPASSTLLQQFSNSSSMQGQPSSASSVPQIGNGSANGNEPFTMVSNAPMQLQSTPGMSSSFINNVSNHPQGSSLSALGAPLLQAHSTLKPNQQMPQSQLPQHTRIGQLSGISTNPLLTSMANVSGNNSNMSMYSNGPQNLNLPKSMSMNSGVGGLAQQPLMNSQSMNLSNNFNQTNGMNMPNANSGAPQSMNLMSNQMTMMGNMGGTGQSSMALGGGGGGGGSNQALRNIPGYSHTMTLPNSNPQQHPTQQQQSQQHSSISNLGMMNVNANLAQNNLSSMNNPNTSLGLNNSPHLSSLNMQNNANMSLTGLSNQPSAMNLNGQNTLSGFVPNLAISQAQQMQQAGLHPQQLRSLANTQVQVQMQPKLPGSQMQPQSLQSASVSMVGMGNHVGTGNANNGANLPNNANSGTLNSTTMNNLAGMMGGGGNNSGTSTGQNLGSGLTASQSSGNMANGASIDSNFRSQMLLSQPGSLSSASSATLPSAQQAALLNRVGPGVGISGHQAPGPGTGLNPNVLMQQQQQLNNSHQHMSGMGMNINMGMGMSNQMSQQQLVQPGQIQMQNLPRTLALTGPNLAAHSNSAAGSISSSQQQPGNGSNTFGGMKTVKKPWHSADHMNERNSMVSRIVSLLQQRRPNATADWHQKLPQMAKRLEDALYNTANSLEDYNDIQTLKVRLQLLAQSMGGSRNTVPGAKKSGPTSPNSSNGQSIDGNQNRGVAAGTTMSGQQQMPATMNTQFGQQQHQQLSLQSQSNLLSSQFQSNQQGSQPASGITQMNQMQQLHNPFMSNPTMSNMDPNGSMLLPQALSGQMQGSQLQLQHNMQLQMQQGSGGNMGGMLSNNNGANSNQYNMMNNNMQLDSQSLMQSQGGNMLAQNQSRNNSLMDGNMGSGFQNQSMNASQPRQFINMSQINPLMTSHPPSISESESFQMSMNQNPSNLNEDGSQKNRAQTQHSEEHRRQVLKQQQQRLLLLRHASKCPHENGRCPVTPHCAGMKLLWKHIMSCKDQECKVAHCVSSRYVLSHYSKCKEQHCPVCGPVREAIRRNYDRSRRILSMGKNPNGTGSDGSSQGLMPNSGTMSGQADNQLQSQGNSGQFNRENSAHNEQTASASAIVPASGGRRKHGRDSDRGIAEATPASAIPASTAVIPQQRKPSTLLDPISCALYSFSTEMIQEHIKHVTEGLLTASGVRNICMPIIDDFIAKPGGYIFATPVDPIALHIPDYFDIIKNPMDLGTVKKRLESNYYRSVEEFANDVQLTFDNAMLYNPKNLDVHQIAKQLRKDFDVVIKQKLYSMEKETDENKKKGDDHCVLCGQVNLKFEPPVYYCNGRCNGQRIRRNAFFFSTQNNAYHWCNACYNDLKENQALQIGDSTLYKRDLTKKKHTEESDEPWVQCDNCQRWVHQICTLFNGRRNFSDAVGFMCPYCILLRRSKKGAVLGDVKKRMQAADLPHCKLSEFIEKRVYERLEIAYNDRKERFPTASQERCPPIYIRQVSSVDKMQPVRDGVYNRYRHKDYPSEFPCRTKWVHYYDSAGGQGQEYADILLQYVVNEWRR